MSTANASTFSWRALCGRTPLLMGIVNATPDSFSGDGLNMDAPAAARQAQQMVRDGAAIIDIGGESTRPGAQRVGPDEQVARVVPVVRLLAAMAAPPCISVDTTRASVARAAIGAGARVVNDVSAGMEDPALLGMVAEAGTGIILMHRVAAPPQDHYSHQHPAKPAFADVVGEVCQWLSARATEAERAGIARHAIAVDPGLGFGKDVEQNFALVAGLQALAALGYPVVVGASRKSFIGAATGAALPAERVWGSVAVGLMAAQQGAAILRVHDVAEHRQALAAWYAPKTHQARGSGGRGEHGAPDG